jgi:hypothetical protein
MSSRETERDGDSIGTDGPIQRYTHAAGRPPAATSTIERRVERFVSPSSLGTSVVALATEDLDETVC